MNELAKVTEDDAAKAFEMFAKGASNAQVHKVLSLSLTDVRRLRTDWAPPGSPNAPPASTVGRHAGRILCECGAPMHEHEERGQGKCVRTLCRAFVEDV